MSRTRVRAFKPVPSPLTPYQAVIDVLLGGKYNAGAMIGLLAKDHPELFMQLHEKTTVVAPPPSWMKEVVTMKIAGEHVPAIKLMREHTGFGLKQAKDVCDHLGDRLSKRTSTMAELDAAQTDLLNQLLVAAQRGITVNF